MVQLSDAAPREGRTIAQRLSEQLAEAIVRGEIKAGSKISEPELARRYDVSRGPLREAIRRLEGLGLLRHVPHVGARVVTLGAPEIREIYQIREGLEGMAARLAATHMPLDEIDAVRALLDRHEAQIEQVAGREYFQREGDLDFHYRVIRGSQNQRLINALCGELYHLVRMYRYRSSLTHSRPFAALAEHRQIIEAIGQGDQEFAEMLMRRHIAGARRSIEQQLASLGGANVDSQGPDSSSTPGRSEYEQ